jgi:hypothetical protein
LRGGVDGFKVVAACDFLAIDEVVDFQMLSLFRSCQG